VDSPSKQNLKSSPAVITNSAATLDLNKSLVEVVSLSEEEDSADGMQCTGDGRIPCDQSEIKTVILFEDVDATLCEDRGFISTIQLLADAGKRPMILTSNSKALPEEITYLWDLFFHHKLTCLYFRLWFLSSSVMKLSFVNILGENPVLPDSLAREEVCFTLPPLEELIHHMYLVCHLHYEKLLFSSQIKYLVTSPNSLD